MKTSAIESGDTRIINPQCRFPAAAPYLQIQLHIMEVPAANDLARAFERATKARANALTMTADPTGLFVANQKQIVELAAKKRLPAIYTSSTYVNAGGLMSYAPNELENYRARRDLRGQNSERSQAGGFTRRTTHEVWVHHQSESGKADRPHDSTVDALSSG
jgi:hypothetical protein